MTPPQRVTLWFVVVTAILFAGSWIVYDLWVYRRHGNDATISRVMLHMGRQWPLWIALWVAPVVAFIFHVWGSQDTSPLDITGDEHDKADGDDSNREDEA